ncbi:hypothetical protein SPRG_07580 [Saprolegnia parasitica CBS 223.65]|uniref:VLIG-type G domain-containing protein n=1 Tax=Saprolegnia parasitica (strain CBS 223.65) TaxID=695850 RepID=A0A067CA19_SAPPC|nr:hypothetical protein SPRG_07580 [Saprolegnia parasitica CBS 223.65]KDO27333.1 hypothetical protein SPRG_07580 [Saprolegnia parasitica CBS 223.65]|eukprot:XP_012202104.1 hypothetical protein SPRG_07580 [Saprolegnia parasitica CBS 223.65]
MTESSVATSYEELNCYHLLETVVQFEDGSEVFQPTLKESELFRLLRALGVVDAEAALPEGQLGRFVNACLNSVKIKRTCEKYRSVDVVACYGKQAAVEADLRAQGWWPTRLETYLHAHHEGVYAMLLPEASDRPKLVLFTWLLDPSFSPQRLRERATYALRFLTLLTPIVRCCIGDAEWDVLERADDEARAGSSRKKHAVKFHVRTSKDLAERISCDVASAPTTVTPGDMLVAATEVAGVTMHLSHDHDIRQTSGSISVASPAAFATWLLEATTTHRLQIRVQLPRNCKRAVLEAMNLLPTMQLSSTTKESLLGDLRVHAKAEAAAQLAAIENHVVQAGAKRLCVHGAMTAADEADAHKALLTQKRALALSLVDVVDLPTTFQPPVADLVNAEYARLLDEDPDVLAAAKRTSSSLLTDMATSASLEFPFLAKHKVEMELVLLRSESLLRDNYDAWCQEMRAFLHSEPVVASTTNQCFNALVGKVHWKTTLRCAKEAIVHEAFVAAITAANAKHAPTDLLCVHLNDISSDSHVHFQKEYYVAGGATQLTLTPVSDASLGSLKLPRDAHVVDAAFVAGPRTFVIVVFTRHDKTHVQSYEANGARPMTRLVAREFPTLVERCDFDAARRLLALQHTATKVDIFAFNESFKVVERAHQFDLLLLSPSAPYAAFHLLGGDNPGIFVVGDDGCAHAYHLGTHQQSKLVPAFATPETKVVKLQNGAFMVCIEPLDNENDGECGRRLRLRAFEIPTHAALPLVTEVALPMPLQWSTVQARASDDTIVLLDQSSGAMMVLKMKIVIGKLGFEVCPAAPVTASESHVLAPLCHVFEKFPVQAAMTQHGDDRNRTGDEAAVGGRGGGALLPTALQLHVQASSSQRRKTVSKVVESIMRVLRTLNESLASLSLANNLVVNGELAWATMALGRWVLELVGSVAVPICRLRDNELELLRNGNVVTLSQYAEVHQMVPQILFGPSSYILKAWSGPIVVITSMGKPSTGKSYFLNHLTGSSFAVSGGRCTDGVWLALRPYRDALVVVLDFEGLRSSERSTQEDTLLSVLNAAISQLTIFRIDMRFGKDIDAMFSNFQKGISMLKGDNRLFSGQLYINAKDMNPDDAVSVMDAFTTKLARLLTDIPAVTVMYGEDILVTDSAPPNRIGNYDGSYCYGLAQASICLAEARDRMTFSSGADFHEFLALVLAKLVRRDWTSMDDNIAAGKTVWLREQLRFALCNGKLDAASTMASPEIWAADDETMVAQRQAMGLANMVVPRDTEIDFGLALDGPTDSLANLSVVKATLLHNMGRYARRRRDDDPLITAPRRVDHEVPFDVLWKYILWRREHRVRAWFESLGGASRQLLQDDLNNCVETFKQLLRRCEHTCSTCKLGCFESFVHGHAVPHDCGGSHRCEGRCAHCKDDEPCGAHAGHAGACNCGQMSHTCSQVCHLAAARNCDGNCHLNVDHSGPHVCSVSEHLCPEKCEAENCRNACNHGLGVAHVTHSCGERRCQQRCSYVGCTATCATDDHFHAINALHSCGIEHTCHAECSASGVCELKVQQETMTAQVDGASVTSYHQANNAFRKKCNVKIQVNCVEHNGKPHRCDANVHTCDARCPRCNYYCTKAYGHEGAHATTHGTMALAMDGCRSSGARDWRQGVAETCPFFCSKLGRGHVHYVPCSHTSVDACTYAAMDGHRHSKMTLASNPTQPMDEVLHDTYWTTLGWEDPVSSALERDHFGLCSYECEAPKHKANYGGKSHCVLGARHEPVVDVTTLASTQSLVQGHVFNCQHVAAKGLHHHVFVLDASRSMSGEPWTALTAAFHAYLAQQSQSCADIVSVVTFDRTARIVHERKSLVEMTDTLLPFACGISTDYDAGLRSANDVLSRNDHATYTPHIAKTYNIYRLQSSCVGFGDSKAGPLKTLASHLGGTFTKAQSDSDLLAAFKKISVAVHNNAGQMMAKTATTEPV